jgi:hypothetical protein
LIFEETEVSRALGGDELQTQASDSANLSIHLLFLVLGGVNRTNAEGEPEFIEMGVTSVSSKFGLPVYGWRIHRDKHREPIWGLFLDTCAPRNIACMRLK